MATKKVEIFTGSEDVNKFTTKCDLHCNLKGYEGEKKAAFIAGRLDEHAFDVYMALSDDDKKDPEKIKAALVEGFDDAKRNREVAFEELSHRKRLDGEKAEVYAHKILELLKYAYPKFTQNARNSLAKDYYVKGLQLDVQKELRKMSDFEDKTLSDLIKQTTYLEIAIANASATQPKKEEDDVSSVTTPRNSLEARLDKLTSLMERTLCVDEGGEQDGGNDETVNSVGNRGRGRGQQRRRGNPRRGRGGQQDGGRQQPRHCRNCNKTDHMFRQCPDRFCQSCGNKGHDGWDRECPKYQ